VPPAEEEEDNESGEVEPIIQRPAPTIYPTPTVVTPYTTLRSILDDPRYDAVRQVLSNSNEGVLSKYTFKPEANSPCFKALVAPEPMMLPPKEMTQKGKKRMETRKKYFMSNR